MSSANVTIKTNIITRDTGYKQANAAFHGDERMLNVLLRTLVSQDRSIASQVQMGGVVTGFVSPGTGSATITVGFQPAYVRAFAYTGVVINGIAEAYSGMAQSSVLLLNGNPLSATLLISGGITFTSTGFKGGTNVFPVGKKINYIAMRRVGA